MDNRVFHDISYGMYIVSTVFGGRNVGCFVNTVTQITSENPIVSISVNKSNYTSEALTVGRDFAISILSEESDPKVIGKFGFFSSRDVDKFEDVKCRMAQDIPVVDENICGYLICKVIDVVDSETHNIVLARVLDTSKVNDFVPMTYSYYHRVIKGKAPKTAPTYIEENEKKEEVSGMAKYRCTICGHIYDEAKEKVKFDDLPEDWVCPLCGVGKDKFEKVEE